MIRIIYTPKYNISALGLERLHPFDSQKYGRIWRRLHKYYGSSIEDALIKPRSPVIEEEILLAHTSEYLEFLKKPYYISEALELPPVGLLPGWVTDYFVLRPMRWATSGTILAAKECLSHGFVINLGGGYHHAKPEKGEGFCIYSDIAIAIHSLRADEMLKPEDKIAYIDLDAHQGNGVSYSFMSDRSVSIFDMYNGSIYPRDTHAQSRVDCKLNLQTGCGDEEYLEILQKHLPSFLDAITETERVKMAIYNAGTDVYYGDQLGQLSLSSKGILTRDSFVVRQLRERGIPSFMLLSGGYTKDSYKIVANSIIQLNEEHRIYHGM